MIKRIILNRATWEFDDSRPLGRPGGFGAVFRGKGELGDVAIKRLHPNLAAEARELLIAEGLSSRIGPNIIRIHDTGAFEGASYVVMEVAERNLRSAITPGRPLEELEARSIVLQLLQALSQFDGVVHRDIKPENVLFAEGRWKVADFGIGRIAEATTDKDTLRQCMSPPYAAPEQWRLERASSKTDLYAVGCIAYELTEGRLPFQASTIDDFREQHLHAAPTAMTQASAGWSALVLALLAKPQPSRPSVGEAVTRLQVLPATTSDLFRRLAQASANDAQRQASQDAAAERARTAAQQRQELAVHGRQLAKELVGTFAAEVRNHAPTAKVIKLTDSSLDVRLGVGRLEFDPLLFGSVQTGVFRQSKWDVVLGGRIRVSTERYSRSASVWFADVAGGKGSHRWIEVAYFRIFGAGNFNEEPTALPPGDDADVASSNVISHWQTSPEKPVAIDGEDQLGFVARWLNRLADAAEGLLQRPRQLPEAT